MDSHLAGDCILKRRLCELGCLKKVAKRDLENHLKKNALKHVDFLNKKTQKMQETYEELRGALDGAKKTIKVYRNFAHFILF